MPTTKSNLRALFTRIVSLRGPLRGAFVHLATGGDWAITQPPETRRNLIWFWLDGFFASAGDNIVVTYLVVYLLALGATQAQVGLLSALSSLSAALLLLPGAMLVERIGRRRDLVLVGGGWARLALLFLALAPLVVDGPPLVTLAIALAVSRDALANLCYPAWISLTADIVPMEGRGRFFASRNFIMGISGMAATFVVGLLITRSPGATGYQAAIGLAFAIGAFSIFSFAHLRDGHRGPLRAAPPAPAAPPAAAAPSSPAPAAPDAGEPVEPAQPAPRRPRWLRSGRFAQLAELLKHRDFVQFAAITALWNFSINIAGPFFNVFLVQELEASAAMVGLTAISSSVAGLLAQRKLGELNDRWGSRRLAVLSGLLIPLLPFCWVFVNAPWQIIPINFAGGILWGAYNMGSFNYLLVITPADRRARFSALFQIIVTLSLAVGAALGSLFVTRWGYDAVFILTSLGRLAAAGLFARISSQKKVSPKPAAV